MQVFHMVPTDKEPGSDTLPHTKQDEKKVSIEVCELYLIA